VRYNYDIWMVKGAPLGVKDGGHRVPMDLQPKVELYPNPSNGFVSMHVSNPIPTDIVINGYTLDGRPIWHKSLFLSAGSQVFSLPEVCLVPLPSGVYLIRFNSGLRGDWEETHRLIINK